MVCVVLCVCVRFCDALRVFLWTSCVSLWLLSLCSSGWQPMSEVRPGRGELRQRCSLDRCNAKGGGSRSLHDAGLGHATFCTGVEIPLSLTTLATSLSFFLFFFFWFFPRSAREKPKKEKKEKGERGDKGSKGEGDLDSTYNVFCCFGVVASVAGKFRGVSRFNFGVPFREFRGDSASRVLISACLSAYPGCQKSAFPRIQGARNQRLQGARNQRCGVYFGLAPRVGVERVQLFVGVGASSWCNFFRLWSPRRPLRRAFFFLAVFSGARRWWVLLLVVVLVGWL